jgi:hypothetical protein
MLTRMGYYNYQSGLIYRHLNQEGGWDHHQEHCRQFILNAIKAIRPEKITVLGSGWLLDLPFAEMVENTKKIRLVDIIHPPDVVLQAGELKNVELIEDDISGGLIKEVWEKGRNYSLFRKRRKLTDIVIPEYSLEEDPGMVISLNILTQLESQLVAFLRKRVRIREDQFDNFKAAIQKKHLDFLLKHNSVIVTDYAEILTDKSGKSRTVPTLFTELPAGKVREEWIWNFDHTGADFYNTRSQFKVVALII